MAGPPPMTIESRKAELRKVLRQRRAAHYDALAIGGRRDAAIALARHVVSEIAFPEAGCIAGYFPAGSEINPLELMSVLAARGHQLALPVVGEANQPLIFRRYLPGDLVLPGALGILAPLPETPAASPDAVLVPMIGFDRKGRRLGQGAGYYDRTLALRRPACVVGIAFAIQEIDEVPVDERDQSMDAIVTETGVIRCDSSS